MFPLQNHARFVLAIILLYFTCRGFAQAQHVEIPAIRSDVFDLADPTLRVELRQVRKNADYVIGVTSDNKLQHKGYIEIGDFVTSMSVDGRRREFQSFMAVPREQLSFGKNSITVSGLDQCKGDLSLLLTVPLATKVIISVNGETEFAGTFLKGAILHHGRMVATEFLGRHQLFVRLLFPEIDTAQLEMIKTKSGYLWSQEALNKHLISFNKPLNHPESIGDVLETVTLTVKINTKGNVVLARALNGREPFVSEAVNAVSQARFIPFIVNGSAVDALGDVTVVFSKDGRVSSTLKQ